MSSPGLKQIQRLLRLFLRYGGRKLPGQIGKITVEM